jgi:hypothetical protein
VIAIPPEVGGLGVDEVDLAVVRESYLGQALRGVDPAEVDDVDVQFLADETRLTVDAVRSRLERSRLAGTGPAL